MSISEELRGHFPAFVSGGAGTYLDNAAMTQIAEPVLAAMAAFERSGRANVKRGVYPLAGAATDAFEAARAAVARYVGASDKDEVVFTSGATAAINLVAHSFGNSLKSGDEIIVGEGEHHANIVPWQMLRARKGVEIVPLPVDTDGHLQIERLPSLMSDRTRLIAVTHGSNVTGAVTDVRIITAMAKKRGVRVLVDGAQRAAHGRVDTSALGCDFYVLSGHKMYAPTGIGALWARKELLADLPPFLGGGEMIHRVTFEETTYAQPPHRFEAGTPPVTQAIGLGAAADWLAGLDWAEITQAERGLTQAMLEVLTRYDRIKVWEPHGVTGGRVPRLPILSFTVTGAHPHDICELMGADGVSLRGGHHCAQPLMDRLGVTATTRASLALYTTQADVDAFAAALDKALKALS